MPRMRAPWKNKYLYFLDEVPAMVRLRIQIICTTKREIKWDTNKAVAVEDTAAAADTAAGRRRCIRRYARTARRNAPSRLSQAETVRFTARIASRSAEIAVVKSRTGPFLG